MNYSFLRFFIVAFFLLAIPNFAKAQVHGPGPSDPTLFDTVINLPPDPDVGSDVTIGGVEGQTTQVNVMDGGSVGWRVNAFSGLEMNVSGGIVSPFFDAYSGSETNVIGGRLRHSFEAKSGSLVNISGGTVDDRFTARSGSEVNISGGAIGFSFNAESGSDVELFGGEFKLNGDAFTGSAITLSEGDLFSGTLTDGSAVIFSSHNVNSDRLVGVTLTSTALPALDTTPIVVNTRFPNRPSDLRAGQSLTLEDGGALGDYFEAVGATLNIKGGSLGSLAGVSQSEVTISGGTVGPFFDAYSGSVVNISGGSVGSGFDALAGSEVNISGGSVDQFSARSGSVVNISGGAVDTGFDARSGSEVNISGGSVGSHFEAYSDSVVNISGGTFGDDFIASSGSEVNLFGTEFLLGGDVLESLVPGEALTITDRRRVLLWGHLADGTPFDFVLNPEPSQEDFFDRDATLTVTLVEEGDFDFDGDIDDDDVDYYIGSIGQAAAGEFDRLDLDDDGMVTLADHNLHVSTLVTTSNGVTGALLGDVNLDGTVDVLGDAFPLVSNLGQSATSRSQGDLNADGVVNVLGDGFLLVGDLGKSNASLSASATSAVPEPGCLALLMAVALTMSSRRHR